MIRNMVFIENNGKEIKNTNFFSYQSKVIPKFDFYLSYHQHFLRLLIFDPEKNIKYNLENTSHIIIKFPAPSQHENGSINEGEITLIMQYYYEKLYSIEGLFSDHIDFNTNTWIDESIHEIIVYYSEDYTFPNYKIFKLKIIDERLWDTLISY